MIARVAEVSAGRAIDIVAIAESIAQGSNDIADVAAGLRAVVARDLAVMPPERREFLQMLALIEEPIPLALLQQLWSEEHFLPLLQASSERYLTADPTGIGFRHAALAQAIRETIAIDVPYRRRIIAGIAKLAAPSNSDLERVIAQARACGDDSLELEYLKRLADAASTASELPLLAKVLERMIALMPFKAHILLPLYTQLSVIYNGLSRGRETLRVCMSGLDAALAAGARHDLAPLVTSMALAAWHDGDKLEFERLMARYGINLESDSDRTQLALVKLTSSVFELDVAQFEEQLSIIHSLDTQNPVNDLRLAVLEALMSARLGEDEKCLRLIAKSRVLAAHVPKALRFMPEVMDRITTFYRSGATNTHSRSTRNGEKDSGDGNAAIEALLALSVGHIEDSFDIVNDALVKDSSGFERRVLIGIGASAGVLSGAPVPQSIMAAARNEAELIIAGTQNHALVPIAAALAALDAESNPPFARALFENAITAIERTAVAPQSFFIPTVLAKAALRLNDRTALKNISKGLIKTDKQPWSLAQSRLAAYCSSLWSSGRPDDMERITLVHQFNNLGAPFFISLIPAPGISRSLEQPHRDNLSRREREVVALVAEGRTNRQIAGLLVLSERTIEGHVANVFNKIGATSRAQIATWYSKQPSLPA
ncbi:MAG: hypothetical protein HKL91_05560 [Candidatus Eremiobacteraeota bacterium]|nr:hypothetical protein [Candidatus Eremiobacteraeota bacterium]